MKNKSTFFIKKNSTLPAIKYIVPQDILEKYDLTKDMFENCAVTFSMVKLETGFFKIANKQADLIINREYETMDDPEYIVQYTPTTTDTNDIGVFIGEFKIDFLGSNCGKITLPAEGYLHVIVQDSITKTTVI